VLDQQQAKIQALDKLAGDFFGNSVSMSDDGNTAIVGSFGNDEGSDRNGAAYIFTRSGTDWSQQAKIQNSDPAFTMQFGTAVSISGDGNTAIVGITSRWGWVYIFTRSGTDWSQHAKIEASDTVYDDYFGESVSISGDGNTVIVGAKGKDAGTGAAYIFTRSGTDWLQQPRIEASDKQEGDWFGYSVSISSDSTTAIIGAQREDTDASDAGAAYIFTRSGTSWSEQAKIQASDPEQNDWFGTAVSISSDGTTAIVGARREDTGAGDAGAAYIFTRSGTDWSQQAKIQASVRTSGALFGNSVSISSDGTTAIVGEFNSYFNSGRVYIFTRSGTSWSQQAKIQASDNQYGAWFGSAVSISGDGTTAIVGSYKRDDAVLNDDVGAAYIFVRSYYI
jgi:hypothetical protein